MSECIGPGCTSPGCSGRNAQAVNSVGRMADPAATLQSALYARQIASEGAQRGGNRAERRRRERDARRGRRSG